MVESTTSTRSSPRKGIIRGNAAVRYGYPETYDDMGELLADADAYESSSIERTRTIEASITFMPTYFDSAPATPDSTVMLLEIDQVEYS